jgi:hypothetical protein
VFAALLPFVRGLLRLLGGIPIPLLQRMLAGMGAAKSRPEPSSGQTSTVQSKYIRMTLNHDSGDINGEVLAGQFKGSTLDQLNLEALLQLLRECQDDEESVALLQAYLDRVYADTWQQQASAQGQQRAASEPGEMSREEALQVLGLSSDAAKAASGPRRIRLSRSHDKSGKGYLIGRLEILFAQSNCRFNSVTHSLRAKNTDSTATANNRHSRSRSLKRGLSLNFKKSFRYVGLPRKRESCNGNFGGSTPITI